MKDDFEMQDERIISGLQEENTKLRSDISHLNAEIASLNEQLSHMRMMLDEAEVANYHEKLREAIQAERKRWAKEDEEALRVRDIEQRIKGVKMLTEELESASRKIPIGAEDSSKGSSTYNWIMYFKSVCESFSEQLRKELEK